ncbi:MAG: phage head closure protein [Pseudomonadota bacterium]
MSKIKLFDPGRFNRQLSIQNINDVSDGCGGFLKQYQVEGSVWAHLCPVAARALTEAGADKQEISHRVIIRYRSGVNPGTRFTTGSRHFDVQTVHDPDETHRYLECEVIEQ